MSIEHPSSEYFKRAVWTEQHLNAPAKSITRLERDRLKSWNSGEHSPIEYFFSGRNCTNFHTAQVRSSQMSRVRIKNICTRRLVTVAGSLYVKGRDDWSCDRQGITWTNTQSGW